ncbi:MAG TPA: UPF0182 family protein, partial [Candidatus Limnocylindrales bacterium]
MRDLFDEFMDELRRRRDEAEGIRPSDDGTPAGDDDTPAGDDDSPRPLRSRAGSGGSRGGSGRRSGSSGQGGSRDGRGSRARAAMRRLGIATIVVVLLAIVALAGVGVDLWTDAIWFRSVGFDGVFWTRLGTQVLLFVGVGILAVLVLAGNVLLAGRLAAAHPAGPDGGGVGRWRERLSEATRDLDRRGWEPWTGPGGPAGRRGPIEFEAELPDPGPLGLAAIAVIGGLVV